MSKVTLPPPREPAIDPRTNTFSRNWVLYFQQVFDRIGGLDADTIAAISQTISEILQSVASNEVADIFDAAPVDQTPQIEAAKLEASPDLSATVAEMAKQIDELRQQVEILSSGIAASAELAKKVADIEQQAEAAPALVAEARKAVSDAEVMIAVVPDYGAALAEANKTLKTLGTMATQNANAVAITGGAIDATAIGGTTKAAGGFTTLTATGRITGSAGIQATGAATPSGLTRGLISFESGVSATRCYIGDGTGWEWNFTKFTGGVATDVAKINDSGRITGTALEVSTGGSTTISTGAGSVKMSSANSASNAAWIPLRYAGTTYYVPAWTTNSP